MTLATIPEQFDLLNTEHTKKLLKAALPEYGEIVDRFGEFSYNRLLEILDQRLMAATRDMLSGKDGDAEDLERAIQIDKLARQAHFDAQFASAEQVLPNDFKASGPSKAELDAAAARTAG